VKDVLIRYTLFEREIGCDVRFDYQQSRNNTSRLRSTTYGGAIIGPGLHTAYHCPRSPVFSVSSLG
jgi:hypothetical protein